MIVKFIFLLLLHFSNISTSIFIYPLIYLIFEINKEPINWYYFGIIFSIYEFGKFFGLFLWHFLSIKYSNIFLVILSLSFICITNLSFIFSFKIYHIFIIRFFSGFFNNIGIFSKEFYIQLGLKDTKIIGLVSIICTILSLIIPGFAGNIIIDKRKKDYNIHNLFNITILFSLINLLSIILSLILISNKILKFSKKGNFLQMSERLEKLEISCKNKENTKTPQSSINYKRTRSLNHKKKYFNLKVKNNNNDNQNSRRNININSYAEKITSNRYLVNKREDDSKLSKRSSLTLFEKNKNSETSGKEVNQSIACTKSKSNNLENIKNYYQLKYAFINRLMEIGDTLSLIWTLIILHIEYKGNCFKISFVFLIIRVFGEIISFPINTIIIKNYSNNSNKKISRDIIIMNIFLFLITMINNISIFIYYYYFFKKKIMLLILYFSILIRNTFNIINTQIFKIYLAKIFNIHSDNMISLTKYNRYIGCFVKIIIFLIGSYGYYLINLIFAKEPLPRFFIKFPKLLFIVYFIIFPSLNNIVLIIACKFFI